MGDYIEAGGVSGTVQAITVFSTTLVTPDQRTITVPNSGIMGGPITNFSTSPSRRLDMVIGVNYSSSQLQKTMFMTLRGISIFLLFQVLTIDLNIEKIKPIFSKMGFKNFDVLFNLLTYAESLPVNTMLYS